MKQYKSYKVRVVFDESVVVDDHSRNLVADRASMAVFAGSYGWAIARASVTGWSHHKKKRTICILFQSSEHMDKKARQWDNGMMYGYLIKVQHGTSYIPLLVINENNINNVVTRGEPVIHEMMHVLSNTYIAGDTIHDDPSVWAVSERPFKTSAQSHGRLTFKRMIENELR